MLHLSEAAPDGILWKKVLFRASQIHRKTSENTKLETWNLLINETPAKIFSYDFYKNF